MKRKLIPPFLMLFAGAVVSIIMFRMHYKIKSMLLILFAVLVGFYVIGCLLKSMLDSFEKQNQEKAAAEKEENNNDSGEVEEEKEEGQKAQEV